MPTEPRLAYCNWCDNEHNPETSSNEGSVGSEDLCVGCQEDSIICNSCQEVTHIDDYNYMDNYDRSVCNACTNQNYNWCGNCDVYVYHRDNCNCDDEDNENSGASIKNYGYKPTPKFFVRELDTNRIIQTNRQDLISTTPLMGFEIEIEVPSNKSPSNIADDLIESNGDWLYCKEDGSIQYGFEIVSHPHSLAAFNLRNWNWISDLKNNNCTSWNTDTCGIHVHINRSAFQGNSHVWKFVNLVLYNRNEATMLAGRRSNQWASFYREYKKVGQILKGDYDPERYSAVNLTNWKTIEVRMFRGSLHEPRVRAALEFVNANFEYTKSLTSYDVIQNNAMSWHMFTNWVESRYDQYPNLMIYLNKIKERYKSDVSVML